jgi:hypothetical protein
MNRAQKHKTGGSPWRFLPLVLAGVWILLLYFLLRTGNAIPSGDKLNEEDLLLSSEGQVGAVGSKKTDPQKTKTDAVPSGNIYIDFSEATNALALYGSDLRFLGGQKGNPGNKKGLRQPGSPPLANPPPKNSPGSKAISKGSFTVWTFPEDPSPGQSYWVIIQVNHKDKLVNYTRADLSGTVEGTDTYRTQIATHNPANLWVKDNIARLALFIPGGAKLVKDVIQIKSALLKEEQSISISF